jgi:hypothetical protein
MLHMLDSLPAWAAHSEHQEDWAGPSWSSIAFEVHSLLLPGVQDPSKSVLLHVCMQGLQCLLLLLWPPIIPLHRCIQCWLCRPRAPACS